MEINKPVASLIIIVITLVLIFLFVVPKLQEFRDLKLNLAKKQAEYDGESSYYDRIRQVLSDVKSRKESLEKISSALPSDFSLASIIYFLQEKVAENGLILKSAIFLQAAPDAYGANISEEPAKQIKSASFNVDLTSNYQGLKNFLYSLENSARLFEVETISFQSSQSSGNINIINGSQTYSFRLLLKTYTY